MNYLKWILVVMLCWFSYAEAFSSGGRMVKIGHYDGVTEVQTPNNTTLTFCIGQRISIAAGATGVGPFSYQWYKDGVAITDSTNATFSIASATIGNTGEYYCQITDHNSCNVVTNAVNIQVQTHTDITVAGDTNLFFGETAALTASGASNFSWTNMTTFPGIFSSLNAANSMVNITPSTVNTYIYGVSSGDEGYCTSDKIVRIHVYGCGNGFGVSDYNNNTYPTKAYNHQCWTLENLRSTQYSNGETIPTALIYDPSIAQDYNGTIFGRLYDWTSATKLTPAAYEALPAGTAIQGVCPTGWELPTQEDFTQLLNVPGVNDAYDLHSVNYWLNNLGTNAVDFNMRAAGFYNVANHRFENLLGYAYFITADSYSSSETLDVVTCPYSCSDMYISTANSHNAYSVRCLKRLP